MTEAKRPERFDRFTRSAIDVLKKAQEASDELNHDYVGPEHLVLGLVREGTVLAVLIAMGIDPDAVRDETEALYGHGQTPSSSQYLTPEAKEIINIVAGEGQGERTPLHILDAIFKHKENSGIDLFGRLTVQRSPQEIIDWALSKPHLFGIK